MIRALIPYILAAGMGVGIVVGVSLWGKARYDSGTTDEHARWTAAEAELRTELLLAQGELTAQRAVSVTRINAALSAVERMDGDTAARARWAESQLRILRKDLDNVATDTHPCAAVRIPDDSLRVQSKADDFLRTLGDDGADGSDDPDRE